MRPEWECKCGGRCRSELLKELYLPVTMPRGLDDTGQSSQAYSEWITGILSDALEREFLPEGCYAQFVSVLPPAGHIAIPAPTVTKVGAPVSEDILRRFASATYYNAANDRSFFTLVPKLGLRGGAINVMSSASLEPLRTVLANVMLDRTVVTMRYDVRRLPDVDSLASLVVGPYLATEKGLVHFAEMLRADENVTHLNRSLAPGHLDPGFDVDPDVVPQSNAAQTLVSRLCACPRNAEYHARMAMLAERAHIILCSPDVSTVEGEDHLTTTGSSGLTVLLDASMELDWCLVERCYLLAHKLTGFVANAFMRLRPLAALKVAHQDLMGIEAITSKYSKHKDSSSHGERLAHSSTGGPWHADRGPASDGGPAHDFKFEEFEAHIALNGAVKRVVLEEILAGCLKNGRMPVSELDERAGRKLKKVRSYEPDVARLCKEVMAKKALRCELRRANSQIWLKRLPLSHVEG